MTRRSEITDEDLTAWLDGEAEAAQVGRIEAARGVPALEARIARLQSGRDVADGLLAELTTATPAFDTVLPLGAASLPPAPRTAWVPPALGGLAAGLALAVLLGWTGGTAPTKADLWHEEVAAYHALYVTDTLRNAATTPETQAAQLALVSERLGRDLIDLPQTEALTFYRAQELGFEGDTLVQMAFLSDDGVPMALCVLRRFGQATGLETKRLYGMPAATWADSQYRYILIGSAPQGQIMDWAETFRAAL